MRDDLLKTIATSRDVTNALILTHNIDFVFLQTMVLPALRKCGQPSLTVFADAGCASESFAQQEGYLSGLGTRYRVVPIAMRPGFRFHPKALLLSGPAKGTLLVGSGNLTFGGWRENGEVWVAFDTDVDGTGPFAALRRYLSEIVDLVPFRESVRTEVDEAFDPGTREWAAELGDPSNLLGRAGQGDALTDQMAAALSNRNVERLYVCAPYFDSDGEALQHLAVETRAPQTTVFAQSKRTTLTSQAAEGLASSLTLKATTFQHVEKVGSDGQERIRESLLHAKFYAAQSENEVTIFAGSANCSRAALTIPGASGNAELVVQASLSAADFKRDFLDELIVSDVPPELLQQPQELPASEALDKRISVRAARFETGYLTIALDAPAGTVVTWAEIDGTRFEPTDRGPGWIVVSISQRPRAVVIGGVSEGSELRSALHWTDIEAELRDSARGRSLAESIDRRVRSESWSIGAWTEVLSELHKHLRYMPKPFSGRRNAGGGTGHTGLSLEFRWEDVFSHDYHLPVGSLIPRGSASVDERVNSLRATLLRWYGITKPDRDEEGEGLVRDPETTIRPGVTEDDGDPGADAPVPMPRVAPRPAPMPETESQRRRALRVVEQIAARMSQSDFLSKRRPEVLAADIKVTAALLRAGLADGWLTGEDFFAASLKIWIALFFDAGSAIPRGWLEHRYLTAEDREAFASSLRSTQLAAALGSWALSIPGEATSPEHALFDLASALGVARLPWLWQTGSNAEIASEIGEILSRTEQRADIDWLEVERRWLTLIRRGYALNRLEGALGTIDPQRVRSLITQTRVVAGELCWQGGAGFCVAKVDCERSTTSKGSVLVLQRGKAKKTYRGNFLIPVGGLLVEGVLDPVALSENARKTLKEMVDELRIAWRGGL